MPHSKFKLAGHPQQHKKYKHHKRHRKDGSGIVDRSMARKSKGDKLSGLIGTMKSHLINKKKLRAKKQVHNANVRDMDPHVKRKKHFDDLSNDQKIKLHDQLLNNPKFNKQQKKLHELKVVQDKLKRVSEAKKDNAKNTGVILNNQGLPGVFSHLYHGLDERLKADIAKHNVLGLIDPFLIVGFPAALFLLYQVVKS